MLSVLTFISLEILAQNDNFIFSKFSKVGQDGGRTFSLWFRGQWKYRPGL